MASVHMPLGAEVRAIVQNRPLRWGLIAGLAAGAALALAPTELGQLTRWLAAWDVALAVYLGVLIHKMIGVTPEHIAKHAAETDEGRHFILFVSLMGVIVSVAAIFIEAGVEAQDSKALHVVFVMATVALSWLFVHASFATHYTHEYYGPLEDGKKGVRKGLMFPGDEDPDFWDFWHFALVIGVANQTADVQISSKAIRRIVTLHGVAAFVFNTVILALTINLAAGLLQQ